MPPPTPPHTPDEGDFATRLREAIATSGSSLESLRRAMARRGHDLSITTLSYWQNGRSLPTRASSLASLSDLEEILGLEPATLLDLAQDARRPRRLGLPTDVFSAERAVAQEMNELALDLGLRWDDGLDRLAVHASLQVDERGVQTGHVVRQTLRARREVTRMPAAFCWDSPDSLGRVEALRGCRLGRVRSTPAYRLTVAELLLDPVLATDQTSLIELSFAEGEGAPVVPEWEVGFLTPIKVLHLSIDFHPARVPSAVWWRSYTPEVPEQRLALVGGTHVSRVVVDAAPGLHGLRWEW